MDEEELLSAQDADRKYKSMTRELTGLWQHVMLPTVGLGSKAVDFSDKLHAVIHQFRLVSTSMETAQRRAQMLLSFTTDMGTESMLSGAGPADLGVAFPHWLDMAVEDDDGVVDKGGGAGETTTLDDMLIEDGGNEFISTAPEAEIDMVVEDDEGILGCASDIDDVVFAVESDDGGPVETGLEMELEPPPPPHPATARELPEK
eukprot:3756678-Pyramimonas_sp.AAC.1